MERKINFSIGEYYHIYNRGNDKRDIFLDDSDYLRFLVLLYICNNDKAVHISNFLNHLNQGVTLIELFGVNKEKTLVDIGAHCLMKNHFHLLIRERIENGITDFMRKLSTAYSMYFNKKKERTGKLFEGVFKAVHIDNDRYLKYLFSYIHLNPLEFYMPNWKEGRINDFSKAREYLSIYKYSSYLDYISDKNRIESVILNKEAFPEYFIDFNEFDNFIDEWLKCSSYQGDTLIT